MKRLWQSAVVMFLTADAVLLLLFGQRWVRFTHFGRPGSLYHRALSWILTWSDEALLAAAAAEGTLALALFQLWQPQETEQTENGGYDANI